MPPKPETKSSFERKRSFLKTKRHNKTAKEAVKVDEKTSLAAMILRQHIEKCKTGRVHKNGELTVVKMTFPNAHGIEFTTSQLMRSGSHYKHCVTDGYEAIEGVSSSTPLAAIEDAFSKAAKAKNCPLCLKLSTGPFLETGDEECLNCVGRKAIYLNSSPIQKKKLGFDCRICERKCMAIAQQAKQIQFPNCVPHGQHWTDFCQNCLKKLDEAKCPHCTFEIKREYCPRGNHAYDHDSQEDHSHSGDDVEDDDDNDDEDDDDDDEKVEILKQKNGKGKCDKCKKKGTGIFIRIEDKESKVTITICASCESEKDTIDLIPAMIAQAVAAKDTKPPTFTVNDLD